MMLEGTDRDAQEKKTFSDMQTQRFNILRTVDLVLLESISNRQVISKHFFTKDIQRDLRSASLRFSISC